MGFADLLITLNIPYNSVTTIAPTGSISLIADCSPGVEPLYGVQEIRRVMDGVVLTSLHPAFVRRARALGLDSLQPDLAAHPSIQHLTPIPEELHRLFVTAHDVSPEHHVRIQTVFQRCSDSGVSKTINLPATATQAEVATAFMLAYQLGCKGLTVYRTGSREQQVFSCSPSYPC